MSNKNLFPLAAFFGVVRLGWVGGIILEVGFLTYFIHQNLRPNLVKGMEGDADSNQDNKTTAKDLHSYVKTNVQQQFSGSQTPELQGDADKVLVRFH